MAGWVFATVIVMANPSYGRVSICHKEPLHPQPQLDPKVYARGCEFGSQFSVLYDFVT